MWVNKECDVLNFKSSIRETIFEEVKKINQLDSDKKYEPPTPTSVFRIIDEFNKIEHEF